MLQFITNTCPGLLPFLLRESVARRRRFLYRKQNLHKGWEMVVTTTAMVTVTTTVTGAGAGKYILGWLSYQRGGQRILVARFLVVQLVATDNPNE